MKNILFTLILTTFFTISNTQAQLIESMEGALSGANEFSGGGGDVDDWFALAEFLWYPTYGLFFGFEGETYPNEIEFSRYPYEQDNEGIYRNIDNTGYLARGEFNLHFQSNEDNLYGGYGQIKWSPWRFLNFEANHLRLIEVLDNQGDKSDHLSITNVSVQFNRIRHHRIQGWWGVGAMVINGEQEYASPSFVAGTTIYFLKPLSLYLDTQVGYPNQTIATQTQARLQVHLDRFKIYGGYQGTRIGEIFEPNWTLGAGVHF